MRQYFIPIIRWWWLLVAATLLAGIMTFIIVARQPPIYEVRATLVIGRSFTSPNPNSGELYLEQQLALMYANLGTREQISSATMKALNLQLLPEYFVRTVPNTPLIEIVVSDNDPSRAVIVANELANQLIQASPSGKEAKNQDQLKFINEQILKIQEQIKSTEQEISTAQEKLGNLNSARQISDTQGQIYALEQKLISLQSNYANLLSSTQGGAINTLALVQAAELPAGPIGPNKLMNVLLASALGLLVATAAAYGIEYIDNTYKTTEEIDADLKTPILGYIPTIESAKNHYTFSGAFPRSPVADAFRLVRTNLEFKSVSKPFHSLLIAGPDLSMGKSVISTNLAIIYSQNEKKVILADTDLRRPKLSSTLDADKKYGITDVCLGRSRISESLIPWENGHGKSENERMAEAAIASRIPVKEMERAQISSYLHFFPAGTIPPNPAEILSSAVFDNLLKELVQSSDILVLDSPPLFLPDASILLGKVDGVVLVVEMGRTKKKSVKMAIDQINRSGTQLLGIILNRVGMTETYYSKYHTY